MDVHDYHVYIFSVLELYRPTIHVCLKALGMFEFVVKKFMILHRVMNYIFSQYTVACARLAVVCM